MLVPLSLGSTPGHHTLQGRAAIATKPFIVYLVLPGALTQGLMYNPAAMADVLMLSVATVYWGVIPKLRTASILLQKPS